MGTNAGQLIEKTKHVTLYTSWQIDVTVSLITGAYSVGRWKITLQWGLEVARGFALPDRSGSL
jgi:hypothetical protein